MITNTTPVRMTFGYYAAGYRNVYLQHNGYSDIDVEGKVFWVDGNIQPVVTDLDRLSFFVNNLTPNSTYSVEGAYYDAMVDSELRASRFGMNISAPYSVTTLVEPSITSYEVQHDKVDIGVSPPVLVLTLLGSASQLEVQWSISGQDSWTTVFLGGFTNEISIPNIPIGTVDVRVRGIVNFPDGQSIEHSNWTTESGILLDWSYVPPSAPENITFTTAKLAEPSERYDVQVSWDWSIGTGANAREFVLWAIDKTLYNSNPVGNKWAGATLINTGTAESTVIVNHPFNSTQRYRVAATSWGPESDSITYSTEVDFIVDENTPIDNNFTTQTGIEVSYAHIKGLLDDGGTWKQTFLIDAATGAVSIGLLDGQGEAPISFDPASGNVNVKGSVISEEIVSANFVLANFTGDDNPKFYSSGKPDYADTSQGIFIGYDDTDAKFKFDLGDQTKYIRWDGDVLRISGNVVIGGDSGDIPIGDIGLSNGGGFFSQAGATLGVTFDATAAETFFQGLFGSSAANYDVLTQYQTTDPSVSVTKMWDGVSWVNPTIVLHGDMIADGTIRADKLVANTALVNEIGTEQIYDKAAFESGNPEANYKMKIDLVAGSIHIR